MRTHSWARAATALLVAVGAVATAGCGDDDPPSATTAPRPTPMAIADGEPYLKMEAVGLRGEPLTMRFVRDTTRLDMSLNQDGLTLWSVTAGVPVRHERGRAQCRYPTINAARFTEIASEVLWSATPPANFPDNGTWGFLGTRRDADTGVYERNNFTYESDGAVTLGLDVQDRPVSATTPRGPFTLSFGRFQAATVGNASSLPACP